MIRGTIIGEMRIPIKGTRNGVWGRLKPQAARVPKKVANIVAKKPMMILFLMEWIHCGLEMMSSYHLVEKALALSVNIPWVKVKYGSALKESGIKTTIGAIRKNNISPQIILKV
jgi:hypothetical protein